MPEILEKENKNLWCRKTTLIKSQIITKSQFSKTMLSKQSEITRYRKYHKRKKIAKTRQYRERLSKVQIIELPVRLYNNPAHYDRKSQALKC